MHTTSITAFLPFGMYSSTLLHYQPLSLSPPCTSEPFGPDFRVCMYVSYPQIRTVLRFELLLSRRITQTALCGVATQIPGVDLDKYKIAGFVSKPNHATILTSVIHHFVGIGARSHLSIERPTHHLACVGHNVYL